MTVLRARRDQVIIRSSATRQVLQKTDRILGQSDLLVKVEASSVPAPAYTDGKVITINSTFDPVRTSLRDGFTTKAMLTMTALNYHELAHCMFMPRLDTKLVRDIRDQGAFFTFNILQDQADETRFVKLYDPARNYFAALVTQYMLETDEHLAYNYVLVSGRLFIPQRLRTKLADRFHKPELIPEIDRLIARYKDLVYPDDQTEMFDVTMMLHHLIHEESSKMTQSGTTHEYMEQGEPDAETSRALAQQEEDDYEETDDEETDPSSGDEDEQEEDGEDRETDPESEDSGDDEEEGEQSGSDGGSDEDEDPEPSLEDTLEEVLEELEQSVEEEVEDRIEAVQDHEADYTVDEEQDRHTNESPSPELISTVERCVDEFRLVSEKHAPGWHTSQRHGKLNTRQYARALQGNEFVYRRWREGVHDALDFEVVFLLDMSFSMAGFSIANASRSLWVLKRTFEELEGVVTVLGFSNGVYLLSQRGEKAERQIVPMNRVVGSTNVVPALQEGRRILSISRKPLKLCVVITDGVFNNKQTAKSDMEQYQDPIAIVGIDTSVSEYDNTKNVVHTQSIGDPSQLVDVVKNLALRLSDERLQGRI